MLSASLLITLNLKTMKASISNIRSAYNDSRRFANTSSNSGLVEFTHAVREIVYDFHNELPSVNLHFTNSFRKK